MSWWKLLEEQEEEAAKRRKEYDSTYPQRPREYISPNKIIQLKAGQMLYAIVRDNIIIDVVTSVSPMDPQYAGATFQRIGVVTHNTNIYYNPALIGQGSDKC